MRSGTCLAVTAVVATACAPVAAPTRAPSPPASRIEWVDGPHGRLRVDDGGAGGLPVLFVHGNGGNRTQWKDALAHVRRKRRALAFDLSGFGDSQAPPAGDVSVEGYARDIEAVATRAGLSRFVLVGHSYGGAVIAAYAGQHPERLAGLVFADCAGNLNATPAESLAPMRRGLREDYARFTDKWFEGILAGARPETREAVLVSLHSTPPEVFVAATEALYRFDLDAALARYPGPRISISSMLFANPVAIHKTSPNVPVRRIEGASHWLMMDRPEEFVRDLDEFLASVH